MQAASTYAIPHGVCEGPVTSQPQSSRPTAQFVQSPLSLQPPSVSLTPTGHHPGRCWVPSRSLPLWASLGKLHPAAPLLPPPIYNMYSSPSTEMLTPKVTAQSRHHVPSYPPDLYLSAISIPTNDCHVYSASFNLYPHHEPCWRAEASQAAGFLRRLLPRKGTCCARSWPIYIPLTLHQVKCDKVRPTCHRCGNMGICCNYSPSMR